LIQGGIKMSLQKLTLSIASFIVLITNTTFADWRENAKVIKVSGGEDHILVLTQNKWPWGCGRNDYFQLGIGNTSDQWTLVRVHGPNDVGRLENINDVAAGFVHSLALDVNDMVWAWGWNDKGQLGDGSPYPRQTPVQVHGGEMGTQYLRYIIAIAAGRSGEHSLAIDANNFVYAWGQNVNGQCGNGLRDCNEYTPVRVHGVQTETTYLEDIIDVSAGVGHSIALGKLESGDPNLKGRVYTWGCNFYGQLGNGSNYLSTTPVRVLKGEQDSTSGWLENIVAVKAGWDHCVALEDYYPFDPNCKGRVYTWGRNTAAPQWPPSKDGGQLGNGNNITNENSPVLVLSGEQNPDNPDSYLKGIVAVGAGDVHSMALDVNGFVYAWGSNHFGQLGNGTNDPCANQPCSGRLRPDERDFGGNM
jgi:alpha-tubulin suppressor-like RCC1 family protein